MGIELGYGSRLYKKGISVFEILIGWSRSHENDVRHRSGLSTSDFHLCTHDYHTSKLPLPTGRNPVQVQGQAFRESFQYSNLTLFLNRTIVGYRLPRNVVSQRAPSNFRLFTHNGPLNA